LVKGFGDGFFDEAFLEADAQLAGGDLDEVLGFEGGKTLKGVLEKGLLCCGAALLGEGGENLRDLQEGERGSDRMIAEDFFGAGA
jgi:hypothetical protein